MTLDQYLNSEGVTASDFGARCDPPISEGSISRIRRGGQNISADMMRRIIAASGGKVTAAGLLVRPQSAAA